MHAALNMLTSEPASVHQGHDQLHHRHRFWIQMGSPLTASCPLSLALRPLCENRWLPGFLPLAKGPLRVGAFIGNGERQDFLPPISSLKPNESSRVSQSRKDLRS